MQKYLGNAVLWTCGPKLVRQVGVEHMPHSRDHELFSHLALTRGYFSGTHLLQRKKLWVFTQDSKRTILQKRRVMNLISEQCLFSIEDINKRKSIEYELPCICSFNNRNRDYNESKSVITQVTRVIGTSPSLVCFWLMTAVAWLDTDQTVILACVSKTFWFLPAALVNWLWYNLNKGMDHAISTRIYVWKHSIHRVVLKWEDQ
jgi:hypothetical protein